MTADIRIQKIKQLIIDRLNLKISIDDIQDDSALFLPVEDSGLGLDSVDALELAVGIMNTFDVEVTDDDMHIFEYVNTIDNFIAEKLELAS